jgi:leucyl-tRNA synthetase
MPDRGHGADKPHGEIPRVKPPHAELRTELTDIALRQGPISLPERYEPQEFEPLIRRKWETEKTFRTVDPKPGDKTFYCLDMFPYPSGNGLHVGHPVGYIASDIFSRIKRMQGFNVLHPMGWDAFGLPAEQHAIKTGQHPAITTEVNSAHYKTQMQHLGLSFDWDREISTTDPSYYKWTQTFFLKLYDSYFDSELEKARPISELKIPDEVAADGEKAINQFKDDHRLVYIDEIPVNWCPELGTVLANEEVFNGKSEKGHPVERIPMRQIMMRISAFSNRLLEGLEDLDWPEGIKEQQRQWIGKSEGAEVSFHISGASLSTFTSRPETLLGVSFIAVAPENPLISSLTTEEHADTVEEYVQRSKQKSDRDRLIGAEKTGVFTGSYATHPLTGEQVPIFVADYVLPNHGTGVVMGVPAHDQRDAEFAQLFELSSTPVLSREGAERAKFIENDRNREFFEDIMDLEGEELKTAVIQKLAELGIAQPSTQYKLKDWVFSRQRYWGDPIPLITWEDGTITAVPESELPVVLPEIEDFKPKEDGSSALARATDWLEVTDPETGMKGKRETLTMPQWAGSCWYPIRFMDPHNQEHPVDPELEKTWGAVDMYIGGAEHAVLHLLYSRFWMNALHDLGETTVSEPFKKLFNQGMLTAHAYKNDDGVIFPVDEVEESESGFVHKQTGQELKQVSAKMSKSLRNVVNPDDVIDEFGSDSFRVALMFMGPVDGPRVWDPSSARAAKGFLSRMYKTLKYAVEQDVDPSEVPEAVKVRVNQAVSKISGEVEQLKFHTSIAELMGMLNDIEKEPIDTATADILCRVLNPFAPHLSEAIWSNLHPDQDGSSKGIAYAAWPEARDLGPRTTSINLPLQVNGKKLNVFSVPTDVQDDELKALAAETFEASGKDATKIRKIIVIRDKKSSVPRVVNIVSPS